MESAEPVVVRTLEDLLEEDGLDVPELTSATVLLETGLDSLAMAVLVTRLESRLGYDPFSMMSEAAYPRTIGEFVAIYDAHAPGA